MNFLNPVFLPHDRVKGRLALVTYNPDISNGANKATTEDRQQQRRNVVLENCCYSADIC